MGSVRFQAVLAPRGPAAAVVLADDWVDEAKREETRERRAAQAIEMLKAGRTRS
jgi:hypothetical protein